jgi:ribonuclease D
MERELHPEWIDTPDGVRDLAEACRNNRWLALDTEADSLHSYFHKVCLIQVTTAERTALVDPLAVDATGLQPLLEIVADRALTVLMHGADYDVRVLDRDYGARVRGLQDTQIMAQLLGEDRTGLAFLLEREFGVVLNKRHQRADWARRPLTRDQRAYAAADSAYLERLASRLRERLEGLGRWAWAEEESCALESVRFVAAEDEPLAFERLKGARRLKGAARDRLYSLYRWREQQARRLDRPPFKVLGPRPMLALAERPPRDLAGLSRVPGLGPRFARQWGRRVLRVVNEPSSAPERQPRRRGNQVPARVRQLTKKLLEARDRVAAATGLQPGLICPRALAEAVAARVSDDGARLAESGLEGWRLELLGAAFDDAIEQAGP